MGQAEDYPPRRQQQQVSQSKITDCTKDDTKFILVYSKSVFQINNEDILADTVMLSAEQVYLWNPIEETSIIMDTSST
jgi:hypothetical protein